MCMCDVAGLYGWYDSGARESGVCACKEIACASRERRICSCAMTYLCDATLSYVVDDAFLGMTCVSHMQCVAVCCSVLQYVAVCCSVLQCVAVSS